MNSLEPPAPDDNQKHQPHSESQKNSLEKLSVLVVKTKYIGRLLKLAIFKSIELKKTSITIRSKYGREDIDLADITSISKNDYFLWTSIFIQKENDLIVIDGISKRDSEHLIPTLEHTIKSRLIEMGENLHTNISLYAKDINELLSSQHYVRKSQIEKMLSAAEEKYTFNTLKIGFLINNHYFKGTKCYQKIVNDTKLINRALNESDDMFGKKNKEFVKSEIARNQEFLNRVEANELTYEQKESVVAFEDRNLLVAAAGSGKSSTLVGKIGYAIKQGIFEPNEIIALAFNRDAAAELNQRINKRLKPHLGNRVIKAHTFHGLGAHIVTSVERANGKRISIANPRKSSERISQSITNCLSNPNFRANWINFLTLAKNSIPDTTIFENEKDYQEYVERQRRERKNGLPANFKCLSNDLVRSLEELLICNWLYSNGIPFVYEKPFPYTPEKWSKFEPDFYYPDIDVYHEHFALDKNGNAPRFFKNYAQKAQEKRELFDSTIPGRWFETRSSEVRDGTILSALKTNLEKHGQTFNALSVDSLEQRVKDLKHAAPISLIEGIVSLLKSTGLTKEQYVSLLNKYDDPLRSKLFNLVIWPILEEYNKILERQNKIDFSDMIYRASKYLEDGSFSSNYKFILVDEFQDLASDRARLIKALLNQHTNSVLFGVGDDWQSINGFAGSDLSLFMKFKNHFGPTFESELTKTFRSAQGICDVSADFIRVNTDQKKKTVTSEIDKTTENVVQLIGIKNDDEISTAVDTEIFAALHSFNSKNPANILILSRYSLKNTYGLDQHHLDALKHKYKEQAHIEFLTVHKSKGLEADFVFVVRANGGKALPFPSTQETDPLRRPMLSQSDTFPHAEERRLMYVALTRAKIRAFVLFNSNNPSEFVLELMHKKYAKSVQVNGAPSFGACPKCKKGFFVTRKSKIGLFLGCSKYPDCKQKGRLPQGI